MDALAYYLNDKRMSVFQLCRDDVIRTLGSDPANEYHIVGEDVDTSHLQIRFTNGAYQYRVIGRRSVAVEGSQTPANVWRDMPEGQKIYLDAMSKKGYLFHRANLAIPGQTQQQSAAPPARQQPVPAQRQAPIKTTQSETKIPTIAGLQNAQSPPTKSAQQSMSVPSAKQKKQKASQKTMAQKATDLPPRLATEKSQPHFDSISEQETAPQDENVGKIVADRYKIMGTLGKGGMGIVYRAMDTELKRPVALKILLAKDATDGATERFQREVEAVARLHHPNIVTVHDSGIYQGKPYFIMDIVEGEELKHCIGSNKLRQLMKWMLAMCEALHYVHEEGIVHRDLKPTNIIISQNRPIIMDFGLARDEQGQSELTAEGQALGTPAYMAPEQAKGQLAEIDKRVDIYGLGAVMYQVLTGQPPFSGPPMQVLYRICSVDPKPIQEIVPAIPHALVGIVEKAMSKEKKLRYQDAMEMAEDIKRYLNGLQVRAQPASRLVKFVRSIKRSRGFTISMTVFTLISLTVAGFIGYSSYQEYLDNQREIEKSLEEAREMRSRIEGEASMSNLIGISEKYDRVLALEKDHKIAAREKFALLIQMGDRALAGKDYQLAHVIYKMALDMGFDDRRTQDAIAKAEAQKKEAFNEIQTKLKKAFNTIESQ